MSLKTNSRVLPRIFLENSRMKQTYEFLKRQIIPLYSIPRGEFI
jgi:hypothetical protein